MPSQNSQSFKATVNYFSLSALDAIQAAFGKSEKSDPFEKSIRRGVAFLEVKCTALYGFQTDVGPSKNMESASVGIPKLFDTAFLFPFLKDVGLNEEIISGLVTQMERHRKADGFWNYFYQDGFLPDDLDSTSTTPMALLAANRISKEDCQAFAEKLLSLTVQHEDDGVIELYLPSERNPLLTIKKQRRRTDLGWIANFGWLLAQAGLDTAEKFAPTLNILDDALNDLLSCSDFTAVIPNALYYTGQDVIILLLSRYVMSSPTAGKRFKGRLVEAAKARFKSVQTSTHIACRILSGVILELHKEPESLQALADEARSLISMQCDDGSFPPYFIYQWRYPTDAYYGSSAYSTALAVGALNLLQKVVETLTKL